MSLPSSWVEPIFTKLTLIYGQQFLRRWQDLDLDAVKADWAHELDGLDRAPKRIGFALQNLPTDKPPTVLEFRAIAWKMPAEAGEPLPPTQRLDADIVAGFTQKLQNLKTTVPNGSKDWAHRIIARHASGDKILPYSLKLARSAVAPFSLTPKAAA